MSKMISLRHIENGFRSSIAGGRWTSFTASVKKDISLKKSVWKRLKC